MTGDGAPDIVALFAQADERIVLFENDGKGHFSGSQRLLARFPPVYGSMYFSLHDFNGDGHPGSRWSGESWRLFRCARVPTAWDRSACFSHLPMA